MSEVVTISGASATIYGSVTGATDYLQFGLGARYDAWRELDSDGKKRALVSSARYLDGLSWTDDYDTFAERDAVTEIVNASYELAAFLAEDEDALSGGGDDVASVSGGGVSLTFRERKRQDLPSLVVQMLGEFLSSDLAAGPDGGDGQAGSCDNPFDPDNDLDRSEPY